MDTVTHTNILSYETIGIIVQLVTVVFIGLMFFKRPQQQLSSKVQDLQAHITSLNSVIADIKQNHLHTIDVKQDQQATLLLGMAKDLVRLEVTINERIPSNPNQ